MNGAARFFAFWLNIEGAIEKVLQFIMQVKSIHNKKSWFHWTETCIFEHYREVQTRKILLIGIIFAMKICF